MNEDLKILLERLNGELSKLGLAELAIVGPEDCIAQKKNARYFKPEVFTRLVENVKKDKRLESVPLVHKLLNEQGNWTGKYGIISGHHRVEAAKEANLTSILVMIATTQGRDEITSKQLSHNALVGVDDQQILQEMFESIKDLEAKIASGLNDVIEKVDYVTVNFSLAADYKEFMIMFAPDDERDYDNILSRLKENIKAVGGNSRVELVPVALYEKFAESLRKIKGLENIKSNATAFSKMVEIVSDYLGKIPDRQLLIKEKTDKERNTKMVKTPDDKVEEDKVGKLKKTKK
jgi:ParB-like chromosome segregation protein Spo0J